MGWVGKVLSFVRVERNGAQVSDVQIDTGGGATVTAEHFAAPGDDSFPLATDYAAGHDVQQSGREAIGGYLDPINPPVALDGDKRTYSRDAATGLSVAEVWAKNTGEVLASNDNGSAALMPDGSIIGQNGAGSFELQAAGDFVVNGVIIKPNGQVIIPASLLVNAIEVADHDHAQANDSAGNTEVDVGPMK